MPLLPLIGLAKSAGSPGAPKACLECREPIVDAKHAAKHSSSHWPETASIPEANVLARARAKTMRGEELTRREARALELNMDAPEPVEVS